MANRRGWLFVLAFSACFNSAAAEDNDANANGHEQLNAALWVSTSGEYNACAQQAYNLATEKLDLALRDSTWTASTKQFESVKFQDLPPAVIVNLDETVWNNSPYQGRLILQYGQYDFDHFAGWTKEAKCSAVPGAKKFLEHANDREVAIVYISPRPDLLREATLRNLKALDLLYDSDRDQLLLGQDWDGVIEKHRILLIISDSLSDFLRDTDKTPAKRRELAVRYADNWGLKWFMVPNPMYGPWENSLHNFQYELDRGTRIHNKLQALKTEPEAPSKDEY